MRRPPYYARKGGSACASLARLSLLSVKGGIRRGQEFLGGTAVTGKGRDPQADAGNLEQLAAGHETVAGDAFRDALGDARGGRGRGGGEEHDELITAVAGNHVLAADRVHQRIRHLPQ